MILDVEKILKNLLKNKKISNRVEELDLNKKQLIDAIPILIDMNEEKEDNIKKTLTSFNLINGKVKRIVVLSKYGKKIQYSNNVVTQKINPIDFEEKNIFYREENRKILINSFAEILKKPFEKQKGLYIYGKPGIGKTFIMKRFVKTLAQKNNKVGFINVSNLVSNVKRSFNEENTYHKTLSILKEVNYLFIDDIGSEIISSWFRDEILFSILNERVEKNKVTFFSSNYSISNLQKLEAKTSNQKYLDINKSIKLISKIKALSIEIHLKGVNKRY